MQLALTTFFIPRFRCVELLAGKGGILDVLNTQCAAIQPSEEKLVRDLHKEHKANPFFPAVHQKDAREAFKVPARWPAPVLA